MIELEIDGEPFTNFISLAYSRSLEQLSGQFSFVATDADDTEFPIKEDSAARVLINGFPVLTGFVNSMTPFIDNGQNLVNIQGRDKTSDFSDSTLEANSVTLTGPITLQKIIETTVSALGQNLRVADLVGDIPTFTAEDLSSSKAGQNAFKFVEGFARKRQVLLSTDGDGNIIITGSGDRIIDYEIVNKKGDDNNNVLTAQISYNNSKRYNKYIVVSQPNPVTLNNFGGLDLDAATSSIGNTVIDDEIREGRQLVIVSEKASSPEQNKLRAEWEANFRRAQSKKYRSTTDDFLLRDNTPFRVNTLVPVADDDNKITAIMLIESVGFNLDTGGGTITSFVCVPRDSYTTKLSQPIVEKESNKLGFL